MSTQETEGNDFTGIHANSSDDEILVYTARQSVSRFPVYPPRHWIVCLPEGGARA